MKIDTLWKKVLLLLLLFILIAAAVVYSICTWVFDAININYAFVNELSVYIGWLLDAYS